MKTGTKYDVDYFIRKFEAIPEKMWADGALTRYGDSYCALGHCGGWTQDSNESFALSNVLMDFYKLKNFCIPKDRNFLVYDINDTTNIINRPTPKKRILSALYDIKKMQDAKKVVEEPKTEYIVVEIDRSIREQTKELVMN